MDIRSQAAIDAIELTLIRCRAETELLDDTNMIDSIRRRRFAASGRDASGHDLCWHQPGLWSLLPEPQASTVSVPAWPQFVRGCVR
jgi:hypothetical protein